MNNHSYINSLTIEDCESQCICPELVFPLIGKIIADDGASEVAGLFALLADPTRVRILHALSMSEELCVCDIAFLIGASQSAVSHQLRILRAANAVKRRKDGRTVFYSLADTHLTHALADGIRHAVGEGAHA